MARHIIPAYKAATLLKAYVPPKPGKIPFAAIKAHDLATTTEASRIWRNRFGRAISMDRIELALISANRGGMRDLTDLSRETIDTDPHLGSVLNKRMGSISSLPWEIQPATGIGIDKEKAEYYAEVVREQLTNLPNFRKNLNQIAWGLFDGRAVLEIEWADVYSTIIKHNKYKSPNIIVTGLGWIHPRRISFGPYRQLIIEDEAMGWTGGNFSAIGLEVDSIPYKFIQYTPQRYGEYPEREGLAPRTMYWSFFKRFSARERMVLLELFGKPWRVIEVDPDSPASGEDLEQADANASKLGSSYSARMPRGTKLTVVQPGRTAGQVHQVTIEESDKQISKLVLGQTGTTDGVPAGLNSNQANVMQDEQLMILKVDSAEISEIVESQLTDRIVALNYGLIEVSHAPKFVLRSDLPADRNSELDRLDKALNAGLEISRDEAYEISGFRIPNRDEVIIRLDQPPTPPLAPVAPAPRPVLVYPANTSPEAGEQQPPASTASTTEGAGQGTGISVGSADIAKVITVNEAREGQGLPPLEGEDGNLTVSEYERKMSGKEKEAIDKASSLQKEVDDLKNNGNPALPANIEPPITDPDDDEDDEDDEDEKIQKEIKAAKTLLKIVKEGSKWVVYSDDGSKKFGEYDTKEEAEDRLKEVEYFKHKEASRIYSSIAPIINNKEISVTLSLESAQRLFDKHICEGEDCQVCLSISQAQPETEFGSPETIIIRGRHEVYRAIRKWVEKYKTAVEKETTIQGIMGAIASVNLSIDISPLARSFERRMIQALSLGALDSALEIGESPEEVEARRNNSSVALSQVIHRDVTTLVDFSAMKFEESVRFFKNKKVLPKALYEQLTAAAKQRAFTVAGIQNRQLLTLIRDELTKTIERGGDIRKFKKFIDTRVKSAGFVPVKIAGPMGETLSAAHTDTVFRTNVMTAHGAGRYKHQSQPEVVVRRPVWKIVSVSDARTRETHIAANVYLILASDPFWQTAYPPFGFNCRCRVVTRTVSSMSQVVSGAVIYGLPDPGFSSGVGNLL